VPAIAWAGVIFFMSTRTFGGSFSSRVLSDILAFIHLQVSPHTFDLLNFLMRKCGHFTEYGILAIFLYHAVGDGRQQEWQPRKALTAVILAGLYSLTDEFHQRFVPGRGPSIVDCGYDTLGAMLGILVLYLWRLRSRAPRAS
jgi:VanZ family protein